MKLYVVTKKLVAVTERLECVDNTVLEIKVFVTEKSARKYVAKCLAAYENIGLKILGGTTAHTKIDCINYDYRYEVEAHKMHF